MRLMFDASTVAAVYDRRRCERIGIVARIIPLLASQQGGWLRHQKNVAKPPKTQPGWFSFVFSIGKPPRPRYQQMLRGILLIAQPPLLAVMQGGECARFPLFVYWSSLSLPSPHAARTWRMDPATARFRKADSFRTQARLARCLQELFLKSGSGTYIS